MDIALIAGRKAGSAHQALPRSEQTIANRKTLETSKERYNKNKMPDRAMALYDHSKKSYNTRKGLAGGFESSAAINRRIEEERERVGDGTMSFTRFHNDGSINFDPFNMNGKTIIPNPSTGECNFIDPKYEKRVLDEATALHKEINDLCDTIITIGDDNLHALYKIPSHVLLPNGGAQYFPASSPLPAYDCTPSVVQALGPGSKEQAMAKAKLYHIVKHFPQNRL